RLPLDGKYVASVKSMTRGTAWLLGSLAGLPAAVWLVSGCTTMQVSGYSAQALSQEKTAEPVDENYTMHTSSRAERPRIGSYEIPKVSTTSELTAYYSDL